MNERRTTQGLRPSMQLRVKLVSQRMLVLLALIASIASSGCGYLPLNLGAPGTIGMQRERAVIHDPYPSPDLGPPIVGGRPTGYDLPLDPTKALQVNPHAGSSSFSNRGAFVQPYTGF